LSDKLSKYKKRKEQLMAPVGYHTWRKSATGNWQWQTNYRPTRLK